jgi:hypothetical protein
MWCLWRERNDRNFEGKEKMFEKLRTFFFIRCSLGLLRSPLVISFHDLDMIDHTKKKKGKRRRRRKEIRHD